MRRSLFILGILFSLFVACKEQKALVILHTNDTHSHFEPLRSGQEAGLGGVIERAAYVDSVRNAVGKDNVLLLDAGDFSQGSSYFTELNGELEIKIINALHYDCVTLGNHEFDNGIEDLERRLAILDNTLVVSSNLDLSQFALSQYVKPFAVLERAGRKIGIVGLAPELNSNVAAETASRIPQLDNVTVVNKWAAYLKDELSCDLVIVLSHIGLDKDIELAPQISNVDLIIGGHSHSFIDDIEYALDANGKKLPIITDGCWGLTLGQLTLR